MQEESKASRNVVSSCSENSKKHLAGSRFSVAIIRCTCLGAHIFPLLEPDHCFCELHRDAKEWYSIFSQSYFRHFREQRRISVSLFLQLIIFCFKTNVPCLDFFQPILFAFFLFSFAAIVEPFSLLHTFCCHAPPALQSNNFSTFF